MSDNRFAEFNVLLRKPVGQFRVDPVSFCKADDQFISGVSVQLIKDA